MTISREHNEKSAPGEGAVVTAAEGAEGEVAEGEAGATGTAVAEGDTEEFSAPGEGVFATASTPSPSSSATPSPSASNPLTGKRTLLHACCGPCTLEPSRVMREEGHELVVYYANSNIWPAAEYEHRLATLEAWAATDGLRVVAGEYDPSAWAAATDAADKAWRAGEAPREERCRACYRQRLEAAAAYAAEHGYEVLATTLAVSPYQHTDIIREEVYRAAEKFGLEPYFEDFRPNYDEATRRSRALGMYRQNYCGCALSEDEAAETRARIKQERTEEKAAARAAYEAEHAEELAAARTERAARAEERRAYDAKQARKHEILRTLRQEAKKDSSQ